MCESGLEMALGSFLSHCGSHPWFCWKVHSWRMACNICNSGKELSQDRKLFPEPRKIAIFIPGTSTQSPENSFFSSGSKKITFPLLISFHHLSSFQQFFLTKKYIFFFFWYWVIFLSVKIPEIFRKWTCHPLKMHIHSREILSLCFSKCFLFEADFFPLSHRREENRRSHSIVGSFFHLLLFLLFLVLVRLRREDLGCNDNAILFKAIDTSRRSWLQKKSSNLLKCCFLVAEENAINCTVLADFFLCLYWMREYHDLKVWTAVNPV